MHLSADPLRPLAASLILLSACALTACSQRITPIGPGYLYEPDEDERELWRVVNGAVGELEQSEKLVRDANLTAYINGVIRRLVNNNPNAYLPLRFRVFVLNTDTINAAMYPTGAMIIHGGILGRIRNEAQLAMLLGHEITHATHRHTYQHYEKIEDKEAVMTILKVASGVAGAGWAGDLATTAAGVLAEASVAGYGRDLEREADRVGLIRLAQAGYDPSVGVGLWEQMLAASEKKPKKGLTYMYASHPILTERLETCRELITRMPSELVACATDVGSEAYLAAAYPFVLRDAARAIAQRRFALADETLAYLRKHRPQSAEVWAWSGWLCIKRRMAGDVDRARSAYGHALALQPDYPDALKELGLFEAELGNRTRARELLERFLTVRPADDDANSIRSLLAQWRE